MRPLVWFRNDLRVADNPALHRAAVEATRGVVAAFLISPSQWREHDLADVKIDFILRSLEALQRELHKLSIPLLVETADKFEEAPDMLCDLALDHECDGLFYNREYEVNERRRDESVTRRFERAGLEVRAFTDQVVVPPGSIRTNKGDFYTVYTPFKNAWMERVKEMGAPEPLGRPRAQSGWPVKSGDVPADVQHFDLSKGLPDRWPAGEKAARKRLGEFIRSKMADYRDKRDRPDLDGTSELSPWLNVGAISIRQCLHAAVEANHGSLNGRKSGAAVWISELIWREFYRHVIVGYPRVSRHRAFREAADGVEWRYDEDDFAAWREGRTGYPIVDAAMRQLQTTGWMHNRLRMIVAMFLTKDLLIDWRWGERHFMRSLVDGDLASNNGGWQWSASTGTDAQPYFRIFNPTTQSRKCDPDGVFIRRYVEPLREVEGDAVHEPQKLGDEALRDLDYPAPIVDHSEARNRTLDAFKRARS